MSRMVGKSRIHSQWSSNGGTLSFTRDDASVGGFAYGVDDAGYNSKWFGETASAYMQWIAASNELYVASGAKFVNAGTNTFSGVNTFTGSTTSIGDASTDKIGFFGQTATVQGAKVASTGVASAIGIALVHRLEALGILSATT